MFRCECACVCGQCSGCECECHMLDDLNIRELRDIIQDKGGFTTEEVHLKTRNELFRMACNSKPKKILKAGVKLVENKLKAAEKELQEHVTSATRRNTPSPKHAQSRLIFDNIPTKKRKKCEEDE